MSIIDSLGKLFGSGEGNIWGDLLSTGITALSGAYGANIGQEAAKQRLDQELIIAREKMANDLLQQQIAAGAAAASAGATVTAARIADARQREQMRLEAQQALLAGKLRGLEMIKPENVLAGGRLRTEAALEGARGVSNAYSAAGQLISSAYQRPR